MITESTTEDSSPKLSNGYNHSMLSLNIKDKHYICVPKIDGLIESYSTSNRVYIGKRWKDVLFPERAPLLIAEDFNEFLKLIQENHGGLKKFFKAENGKPLKIYAPHEHMIPFFLYFLVQLDQAIGLTDSILKDILKKTNERFWIWDHRRLDLNLELYHVFKEQIGLIHEDDLLYTSDDLLSLPFEYVLLFYAHGKINKQGLLEKFKQLQSYMVGLSVIQVTRSGLETILNDRRVLKEYNGIDINNYEDVIHLLEQDELLHQLFFKGPDTKDISWVEGQLERLKFLMSLLKKYDLDTHDPFPSYDEFNCIQKLYYGQDPESVLDEFFSPTGLNLHELDFFKEFHNKMNTTLINYISVKLSREGQV